jgi:hypothetical protein
MRHPHSLAQRRHNRVVIMSRRRKTIRSWYSPDDLRDGWKPQDNSAWHSCDKWNLNCGSTLCHSGKYFSARRQRRERLKRDVTDNLRAWGCPSQVDGGSH